MIVSQSLTLARRIRAKTMQHAAEMEILTIASVKSTTMGLIAQVALLYVNTDIFTGYLRR